MAVLNPMEAADFERAIAQGRVLDAGKSQRPSAGRPFHVIANESRQ
jgi:hypothetical protein